MMTWPKAQQRTNPLNSLWRSIPTPPQSRGLLSGTAIRGTQVKMENHPGPPKKSKQDINLPHLREKINKRNLRAKFPLLGLQQDVGANQPISVLRPRPHVEGVSERLRLARGLNSGVSDTGRPVIMSPPHPSPRHSIIHLRLA
jgi:hypothetical protein